MNQILIVEDDTALNQGLCKALKDEQNQIVPCYNISMAREQMMLGFPALIILDINLPDGSGLDFLKEIKAAKPDLPVILLTANDTDDDIVKGLEQGADDYITKPFSLSVFRARVNAQMRKYRAFSEDQIVIDHYHFDFQKMEFLYHGEPVELSKTEQKLLRLLVDNRGRTMSRDTLIDRIWTDGAEYVDENALSVCIKRLRDKLHAADHIRTVYGIGYVWK